MSKGQTSVLSGGAQTFPFRPLPVTSVTRSTATVTGSAWGKLIATPRAGRHGVLVWNASSTTQVAGKIVITGSSAPAGSSLADGSFALAPRQSVLLELSEAFDLYGINDSGGGASTVIVCTEVVRS